eukprot:g23400.t1
MQEGVVEVEEAGRFSALLQETSRGFTPLRLHEVSPRALVQRRLWMKTKLRRMAEPRRAPRCLDAFDAFESTKLGQADRSRSRDKGKEEERVEKAEKAKAKDGKEKEKGKSKAKVKEKERQQESYSDEESSEGSARRRQKRRADAGLKAASGFSLAPPPAAEPSVMGPAGPPNALGVLPSVPAPVQSLLGTDVTSELVRMRQAVEAATGKPVEPRLRLDQREDCRVVWEK